MEIIVPRKRLWSPTEGRGKLLSPEGDVLWEDPDWIPNALMDEGEASMLNVYLAEAANPSKYLCLIDGSTTPPAETDTMAYLGGAAGSREAKTPGSSGYNRQQILAADWTNDGLISGDIRFSAAQKTFGPASGSSWTFTHAGLVTAATGQSAGSGKFLLNIALSGPTTVNVGQSFVYTLRWTQQ